MTALKKPGTVASGLSEVIALISRAERRMLAALEELPTSGPDVRIVEALHDLTLARIKLEVPGPSDSRSSPRVHDCSMVCIRGLVPGEPGMEAEVYDISVGGALVACDTPLEDGASYDIELDGLLSPVRGRMITAANNLYHVVFEGLDADRRIALAKHLERHYFRF